MCPRMWAWRLRAEALSNLFWRVNVVAGPLPRCFASASVVPELFTKRPGLLLHPLALFLDGERSAEKLTQKQKRVTT